MQSQRINISLPKDLAREFRRSIPQRSRSKYIAETLRERLSRGKSLKKDLVRSLKANRKLYEQVQKDFQYIDAEEFKRVS